MSAVYDANLYVTPTRKQRERPENAGNALDVRSTQAYTSVERGYTKIFQRAFRWYLAARLTFDWPVARFDYTSDNGPGARA